LSKFRLISRFWEATTATSAVISHGVPPLGGVKQGRVGKTSNFRAKCINISKTVRYTCKVTS